MTRLFESVERSMKDLGGMIVARTFDPPRVQRSTFQFKEIPVSFTLKQLRGLKTGKAVGLDNIPPRLLKDSACIVATPLTTIINASLRQGIVPDDWKSARVTPLFKKGKVEDLDSYRPISVLPIVSKLLERAVHTQLGEYLKEHNILSPYQCGFRKAHSTEFAALSLADTIRRNIEQGQLTGALFIDFRKAFDSIDHSVLLNKLSALGIVDHELVWFEDYLHNRNQIVGHQGVYSEAEYLTSGVPQGSILGPLLFVLYVNDLPSVVRNCKILMYADDTVLFYPDSDVAVIQQKLNDDLELIGTWLLDNGLFVNTSKTESMLFGTHARLSRVDEFAIFMNGRLIKRVYEFKYLGVVFDECITWKSHSKYILSRAGKRLGMLGRIRNDLTPHCANIVYVSFIRPILEYCDTVWDRCGAGNALSLEKLQRRAARIVSRIPESDKAMNMLKWPSLQSRRDDNIFKLVNKCIQGRCPQLFKNYFTFNSSVHSRVTRQSHKLHLPRVRTEQAKKSFYYNGCVVYNNKRK